MRTIASNSIGLSFPPPPLVPLDAARTFNFRPAAKWSMISRMPVISKTSSPVSLSDSAFLSGLELQRQNSHPDQIRAVDAFVAFGDHCGNSEQARAFGGQSREEPEPYSFPARMISGVRSV